jgi:hypothetical protein
MNLNEFSDTFDTLLNSHNIQAGFGEDSSKREITLNEYEKSVLLTQGQDFVVKSYFDRTLNPQGQGFDDSTRRQVDFSSLIKVANLTKDTGKSNIPFDDRGIIYKLPVNTNNVSDVLFILNEKMRVVTTPYTGGVAGTPTYKNYVIVPINYREYDREMSKAYAQPLKNQAWRMFQNMTTGFDIYSELIPKFDIVEKAAGTDTPSVELIYRIRYVKRPTPIILTDLTDDLSIDGYSTSMECSLNPILHMDILNKAVEFAVTTRGGGGSTQQPSANNEQRQ